MGLRPEAWARRTSWSIQKNRGPGTEAFRPGWTAGVGGGRDTPGRRTLPGSCNALSSLRGKPLQGRADFPGALGWAFTWAPSRPCRAPRRRRTCPVSCPSREERQVGPSCARTAMAPSSSKAAAPSTSCARACSWQREGREAQGCFKGLLAGGEPAGAASRMNHRSWELDGTTGPPSTGIPSASRQLVLSFCWANCGVPEPSLL